MRTRYARDALAARDRVARPFGLTTLSMTLSDGLPCFGLRSFRIRRCLSSMLAADVAAAGAGSEPGEILARLISLQQRDVTRALKAAAAAGLHVVGFKIDPQGKIEVVIGKPEAQDPAPLDTWMMTKHARSTEGH